MLLVEVFIILMLALGVAFVVHGANRWFCERYDSESAVCVPWRMMMPIVSSCIHKGVEVRDRQAANERFVIEVYLMVTSLVAYTRFGLGWHTIILIALFGLFSVASMTVTKYGVIPDLVSGALTLLGVGFVLSNLTWTHDAITIGRLDHVIGAAIGIVLALSFLIKSRAAFTLSGSPKLIAASGLLLGWQLLLVSLIIALVLHGIFTLMLRLVPAQKSPYRYHAAFAAILGLTIAALMNVSFIAWIQAILP